MKLSVIIVSYNVQHFLEQCLYSVFNSGKDIDFDVWVVDNNSIDGSVEMVQQKFPQVHVIANKENVGFSKANNQAIIASKAEYVLLLNPDTLVEEDTFKKTIAFMDSKPDAGGLGVYMQDGKGNFLPESKRGLPTPEIAFYKIFGLSALFPNSKKFGKYHLTYLDKQKIHEIDVLSGAFMLMRKSVLEKIGLLDETFFMYGEDIDLSYRIIKGGFKNYYFPDTKIIHYKGESTKKSSVNYVFVFYKAMIIFAEKHFSQKNAKLFSFLINSAIYFRASLAIIKRFLQSAILPFSDAGIIYLGLYFLKEFWEKTNADTGLHFKAELLTIVFPSYILVWFLFNFFSGGYDKPVQLKNITKGILSGSVFILLIYSLLPEHLRFSRALILLGTSFTLVYLLGSRILFHFLKIKGYNLSGNNFKKIVIVGSEEEFGRVNELIKLTNINPGFITRVEPLIESTNRTIGNLNQLKELIQINKINEVIFCAKDLSSNVIIDTMSRLGDTETDFKIAPPESLFIIGSNSINTSGELYTININNINKKSNKRTRRLFDFVMVLLLLAFCPLLMFINKNPLVLLQNLLWVLIDKKTLVGPSMLKNSKINYNLKPSILHPKDGINISNLDLENEEKLNQLYCNDYVWQNDFVLILKSLNKLGRLS